MFFFLVWQNIEGLELDRYINKLEKEKKNLYDLYYNELLDYQQFSKSNKARVFMYKQLKMKSTKAEDFIILGLDTKEKFSNFLHKKDLEK